MSRRRRLYYLQNAKQKKEPDYDQMLGRKKKSHAVSAALTLVTLAVFAIIIFLLLNLYTAKYALP